MTVFAVRAPRRRRRRRRGRTGRVAACRSAIGSTTEPALAEVLTDKATVEISSPVDGVVAALHGRPGDRLAVGTRARRHRDCERTGAGADALAPAGTAPEPDGRRPPRPPPRLPVPSPTPARARARTGAARPLAAPAVRRRAPNSGSTSATVAGSGPDGRVLHDDLDRRSHRAADRRTPTASATSRTVEPVRGRRVAGSPNG